MKYAILELEGALRTAQAVRSKMEREKNWKGAEDARERLEDLSAALGVLRNAQRGMEETGIPFSHSKN